MKKEPLFVRVVTDDERVALQAGLRSRDPFVLRRCQIILASARGERAIPLSRVLGCTDVTVRNIIKDFNARGLAVLQAEAAERLKDLLHLVRASMARRPVSGRWRWPLRSVSPKG